MQGIKLSHRRHPTIPYPLTTRSRGTAVAPSSPLPPLSPSSSPPLLPSSLPPPPSLLSPVPSSSDSSDYSSVNRCLQFPATMSAKPGRCEQAAPNKVPLLTAGEITPEALHTWEMGCLQFFRQKEIAAKDQVGRVAWNLQDPRVQDWYVNDSERLNALTFAAFMLEVCSYWLPSDWATMVRQKLLLSTQGDKAFHV